jgi:hypothetical protein
MTTVTLIYFLAFFIGVASSTIAKLDASIPKDYVVTKNDENNFCFETKNGFEIDSAFRELLITVVAPNTTHFPWHSIRGVSTDDAHAHIQTIVLSLMGVDLNDKETHKPYQIQSFLRDILSSCPSPLFSHNRNICNMRFSPFGTACITISPESNHVVTITTVEHFNKNLVYNLIVGASLLFFANYLAKSKLFQVSILFACLLFIYY